MKKLGLSLIASALLITNITAKEVEKSQDKIYVGISSANVSGVFVTDGAYDGDYIHETREIDGKEEAFQVGLEGDLFRVFGEIAKTQFISTSYEAVRVGVIGKKGNDRASFILGVTIGTGTVKVENYGEARGLEFGIRGGIEFKINDSLGLELGYKNIVSNAKVELVNDEYGKIDGYFDGYDGVYFQISTTF